MRTRLSRARPPSFLRPFSRPRSSSSLSTRRPARPAARIRRCSRVHPLAPPFNHVAAPPPSQDAQLLVLPSRTKTQWCRCRFCATLVRAPPASPARRPLHHAPVAPSFPTPCRSVSDAHARSLWRRPHALSITQAPALARDITRPRTLLRPPCPASARLVRCPCDIVAALAPPSRHRAARPSPVAPRHRAAVLLHAPAVVPSQTHIFAHRRSAPSSAVSHLRLHRRMRTLSLVPTFAPPRFHSPRCSFPHPIADGPTLAPSRTLHPPLVPMLSANSTLCLVSEMPAYRGETFAVGSGTWPSSRSPSIPTSTTRTCASCTRAMRTARAATRARRRSLAAGARARRTAGTRTFPGTSTGTGHPPNGHTHGRARGQLRHVHHPGHAQQAVGAPLGACSAGSKKVILYFNLKEGYLKTLGGAKSYDADGPEHHFSRWMVVFEVELRLRDYSKHRKVPEHVRKLLGNFDDRNYKQLVLDFTSTPLHSYFPRRTQTDYHPPHKAVKFLDSRSTIPGLHYFPTLAVAGLDVLYTLPVYVEKRTDTLSFTDLAFQICPFTFGPHDHYVEDIRGRQRAIFDRNAIVFVGMTSGRTFPKTATAFPRGKLFALLARINKEMAVLPSFSGVEDGQWNLDLTTWGRAESKKGRECMCREALLRTDGKLEFVWSNRDRWSYEHEHDVENNGSYRVLTL
ncbi:hypothetical protein EVG20_g11547 [Dentipellis fragilis]|uniref:Uncharacterized protein n=1 Tax=Dentipellis fragilis TaxID=205917 RepID=A0A4Y9XPE2_9AGAM|nr:hypothetical protein EVG20_g11547 [Dentipellis fragilis]